MKKKLTKDDLKDKLIAYMMEMDLNTLTIDQLGAYASILYTVKNLDEKSYAEILASTKNWCETT